MLSSVSNLRKMERYAVCFATEEETIIPSDGLKKIDSHKNMISISIKSDLIFIN